VYIYGSYRTIKTGIPLFGPPGIAHIQRANVISNDGALGFF